MGSEETIEQNIKRLERYYNNPENGLNKSYLLQRIKELKKNLN